MKDLLSIVVDKLDKLDTRLDSLDKTLVKQEENLREHMRRTELLEQQHTHLEDEIHVELEPIKSHIQQVKGITKFLTFFIPIILTVLGLLYAYLGK